MVGISTAWELVGDGHEVTVYDKQAAAAEGGSFAPSGLMSLALPQDLRASGVLDQLLRSVFAPPPGVKRQGPADLAWYWQARRVLRVDRAGAALSALLALARLGLGRHDDVLLQAGQEVESSLGHLMLWRTEREHAAQANWLGRLQGTGLAPQDIAAERAREVEPGLNPDTGIAKAWYLPQERIFNPRQSALVLRQQAQQRGVRFVFQTPVLAVDGGAQPSLRLPQDQREFFDQVVLCTGAESPALLAQAAPAWPTQTVWGFSITSALREPLHAPRGAVTDMSRRVSISRMGQRVRVSGGLHLGQAPVHGSAINAPKHLYDALRDWFPAAASMGPTVQQWRGAAAVVSDGLPLIGPGAIPGVWLNIGHGHQGCLLAAGSARLLADLMLGRATATDARAFSPARER
jgi:D-amino-acid dehydrogenase